MHPVIGLALVAACGGSDPNSLMSPSSEASEVVEVQVVARGAPVTGAHVVFHDAQGLPLAARTTNASGVATHPVPVGGMVTAIVDNRIGEQRVDRYTVIGVAPGERLVLGAEAAEDEAKGSISVSFAGPFKGAHSYGVDLGCADAETADASKPLVVEFNSECLGSDRALDLLAVAFAEDGHAVAYATARDIPIDSARRAEVELPAWRSEWRTFEVNLRDPPEQASMVGVQMVHVADGVDFDGPVGVRGVEATPLDLTYNLADFGDELRIVVAVVFGSQVGDQGFSSYIQSFKSPPPSITLELDELLLARIPGVVMSTRDGERPTAQWVVEGDLKGVDGGLLQLEWTEPADAEREQHRWSFLLPPDTPNRVVVPRLPDELARYRASKEALYEPPLLMFLETDLIADYRDLRLHHTLWMFASRSLPENVNTARVTLGGPLLRP